MSTITLNQLQTEHAIWGAYNWPGQPDWVPLIGIVEELGELAHSHIKQFQGIRFNENLVKKGKDAVGDMMVYAAHYCNTQGWSVEQLLDATWRDVRERDWIQNPETGVILPSQSTYPWTHASDGAHR